MVEDNKTFVPYGTDADALQRRKEGYGLGKQSGASSLKDRMAVFEKKGSSDHGSSDVVATATTAPAASTMDGESSPLLLLLLTEEKVVATSTGTEHTSRTVHALLESSNSNDNEEADVFLRRLWALLVFQYGTILFVSSPFALVDPFRESIEVYHDVLEVIAFSGIGISLVLAITKGTVYPYSQVALVSLTLSEALEMGLTFANASWGRNGIISLGQATTSFAVILAVLQFPSRSLWWLSYPTAALLCLCLSGLWIVVQAEVGISWKVATAVSLGGWGFTLLVLLCCSVVCKHVTSEEYTLGVLFILVPEALVFLGSKERYPKNDVDNKTLESSKPQAQQDGGVQNV